jgi:hypothetical protein
MQKSGIKLNPMEDNMLKAGNMTKSEYQGMPEGEPKIDQANANGGDLTDTGEMRPVKKGQANVKGTEADGKVTGAPKADVDTLSDDDEVDEKGMKTHKKPIEMATEKSLFPADQRAMVGRERAAKLAEMRKSQDITMHPFSTDRMHKGTEDKVERLLKSDEMYAEDPQMAPALPLIAQGVLCKSCGCKHTAAITSCPNCGSGTTVNRIWPGVTAENMGGMQKSGAQILRPTKKNVDLSFPGGITPKE